MDRRFMAVSVDYFPLSQKHLAAKNQRKRAMIHLLEKALTRGNPCPVDFSVKPVYTRSMELHRCPQIEEEISLLGLGTWNFSGQWKNQDDEEALRVIHAALEGGVNFLDTAPIYGKGHSEEILGRALKNRRSRAFLASKCGLQWNRKGKVRHNLSPQALREELEQSLKRLNTHYLDLLQIHWPNPQYPLAETMEVLEEFRREGKIRYIGVSNFSREQLDEARSYAPLVSYQGLFNILEQNSSEYHRNPLGYRSHGEIFPLMEEYSLSFIPYSPLMQGLLSGKYSHKREYEGDLRWSNPKIIDGGLQVYLPLVEELKSLAGEFGLPLSSMVLRWTMEQPSILSVIGGARTQAQLEENLRGTENPLPQELVTELDAFQHRHRGVIFQD